MRSAYFAIVLLLGFTAALPTLAQTGELPPQIDARRIYVNGALVDSSSVFSTPTIEVEEADFMRIEVDVTLVIEGDQAQDVELFYEKISHWIPDFPYRSPEGPPVEDDTAEYEFKPLVLFPIGGSSYTVVIGSFIIPEFNGVNQARLRGLIDYDVRYFVTVRIWNAESATDEDPVPGFAFYTEVTENAALRPPNPPPFADAGADQTVEAGDAVMLDGSRTLDGFNLGFDPLDPDVFEKDNIAYVWEWVSGPQRVDPEYPDLESQPWLAEVSLDVIGTYVYRLFVSDGVNPTPNSAVVTIDVVANIPVNRSPRAVLIELDEPVVEGAIVTLDASDSSDPDGDDLNYRWIQTDEVGGLIPFEDLADTFQPLGGLEDVESQWQAVRAGTYYFLLIVDDGELSDTATTIVQVIKSESAGVAVGDGTNDSAGQAPGFGLEGVLPGVAGCGGSLVPFALVPLLLWPLRGRIR